MFLLLVVMAVFFGLWMLRQSRNKQLVFDRNKRIEKIYKSSSSYISIPNRPMNDSSSPQAAYQPGALIRTHTHVEDIAIGTGVTATDSSIYKLLAHERDENKSSI